MQLKQILDVLWALRSPSDVLFPASLRFPATGLFNSTRAMLPLFAKCGQIN